MDKTLRDKIEKRITSMGVKKQHIASQIGLDAIKFSQRMNGTTKWETDRLSALLRLLGL